MMKTGWRWLLVVLMLLGCPATGWTQIPDPFAGGVLTIDGEAVVEVTSIRRERSTSGNDCPRGVKAGDECVAEEVFMRSSAPVRLTAGMRGIGAFVKATRAQAASMGLVIPPDDDDAPPGSQLSCVNLLESGSLCRVQAEYRETGRRLHHECTVGEGHPCDRGREWVTWLTRSGSGEVEGHFGVKFDSRGNVYVLEAEALLPPSRAISEKIQPLGRFTPSPNPPRDWIGRTADCCDSLHREELTLPLADVEAWLDDPSSPRTFTATAVSTCAGEDHDFRHEMKVTLHLGRKPPPPLAAEIIPPVDFDRWLPQGTAATDGQLAPELTDGNRLVIGLRLFNPDEPEKMVEEKARWHVRLEETSRHPGVCGNWPLDSGSRNAFDFLMQANGNEELLIADLGQAAESLEESRVATVTLTSRDWGGQCRFHAVAALADGRKITARLRGEGRDGLPVPQDQNENGVGDAWERDRQVFDRNWPATWDEDPLPVGQRRSGDGFTLFEEYRGFLTLDDGCARRHERLDPVQKDLFVWDRDGLVRRYYLPGNPAKLVVRFIDKGLMTVQEDLAFESSHRDPLAAIVVFKTVDPRHRQVNVNTPDSLRYARQFAMVVQVEDADGGAGLIRELGEFTPYPAPWERHPLKYIHGVHIDLEKIQSQFRPNFPDRATAVERDIRATVIHEMGHALGILHHTDGNLRTQEAGGDEVAGGRIDCPMRYLTSQEAREIGAGRQAMPDRVQYCGKSGMGGVLAVFYEQVAASGNKQQQTRLEPSTKIPTHDCFGQIDVKSDP